MISILASFLRFIFRTVVLIGFLVFMLFPTLMLLNHYRRLDTETGAQKADAVSIRLANRLAWLFGVRVRLIGTPAEGPVLIAANHISWLDIPVLHSACSMGFVGKAEIDDWPVFSYIARSGGTIFHQRGCHDSAADVISAMVQRLEQGRSVAIFPEGGIKPGSSVRVFHARMFRPAVDIGCPVQPVMIRYMSDGQRDDDFVPARACWQILAVYWPVAGWWPMCIICPRSKPPVNPDVFWQNRPVMLSSPVMKPKFY